MHVDGFELFVFLIIPRLIRIELDAKESQPKRIAIGSFSYFHFLL